jgi:hypothetical protein
LKGAGVSRREQLVIGGHRGFKFRRQTISVFFIMIKK